MKHKINIIKERMILTKLKIKIKNIFMLKNKKIIYKFQKIKNKIYNKKFN